ncbi:MAG: hypothetical protein K2Z81_15800, partial [Cyanobacteria bacterium]|nr:hypothetical protein [Cyanobacteriota bacterium]
NTFSSWRKTLKDRDAEGTALRRSKRRKRTRNNLPAKTADVSFVPLVLASTEPRSTPQGPVAEIKLPGTSITVFAGADLETLRAIMAAHRECWY